LSAGYFATKTLGDACNTGEIENSHARPLYMYSMARRKIKLMESNAK
jgi:hypothetical protein